MQEALERTARQNPDSPIGQELRKLEELAAQREGEERFFKLGRSVRISFARERYILPSVREEWEEMRRVTQNRPKETQAFSK